MIALLIPQADQEPIVDIAMCLDSRRSDHKGDGWRYAAMPSDEVALPVGLGSLDATAQSKHERAFVELDATQQVNLLTLVQSGEASWSTLDSKLWFEDVLAEVTEIYVSHPSALSAMGFSGIAFMPSWPEIGLNTTQPWEPVAFQKTKV